ncbi:DMT family transporter [Morganella morganii subsp. morganii]|uniref:DMT family transporter n=1 Tax=Morganella morganii TaxID=582 RepID=UPI000662BFD2|nr:DMT family transporter [Morganella morganii]AVD60679.1 EamA/RhaT family transporter [Morganella morganii]MBT0427561.1 DMT family transporter [Morganella morganii subsp. morganii]MBT0477259.1 DMT family transporter [Morganella morganii subsp. morganii]MBT0501230.1 DMT family transporter [Morganella morganii subsp. morganii]MBT0521886.1 DMT family transporter [Morganella morganii subsp. morganii]
MNSKTAAAFAFLGIIWGTNFIFMRQASEWISPVQIVFLRVLCGFVPIAVMAWMQKAVRREHLKYTGHFLVMALLATVIYYWAFASGTSLLLSGVSGVLSGAIPLFSFIVAVIFLRQEKITVMRLCGLMLGFAGVILIAKPWQVSGESISLAGVGYMILGSLSVGISFVYAKKFLADKQIAPLALTTYQIGLALVILACITPFTGITAIAQDSTASLGLIIGLGLLGTGVAYLTYYYLILNLGAVVASSVTYIPPVVALIVGFLAANEQLGVTEILSMVLIMSGVFLLQRPSRRPEAEKEAEAVQ